MHILISGASGFIGAELAKALVSKYPHAAITLTDITEPADVGLSQTAQIRRLKSDLTSQTTVDELFATKFDTIFCLHGIMSSGAEKNLELGMKVNIESFQRILSVLQKNYSGQSKVIFPSSLAVYGPTSPGETVSESTCPFPQSSYGAQKLITETLIHDFSRRGIIDGRVARLPTVIIRPGAPTAAASSFASGIVRESLKGEKNILPVDEDLAMWVCSPKTVIENLIRLVDIPKEKFGNHRVVCLPGQTVTVKEILDALESVGGKEKRNMVVKEKDDEVERIVKSWPAQFDTSRALSLGLCQDISLTEIVQRFALSM